MRRGHLAAVRTPAEWIIRLRRRRADRSRLWPPVVLVVPSACR